MSSISHYLNRFKASLKIDHTIRDGVAQELYTHLEEKTQELEEKGLSKEEASKIAVQSLGSPELIAKQIYETHAQGSWKEALLSASPHLLSCLALHFVLLAKYRLRVNYISPDCWHSNLWLASR